MSIEDEKVLKYRSVPDIEVYKQVSKLLVKKKPKIYFGYVMRLGGSGLLLGMICYAIGYVSLADFRVDRFILAGLYGAFWCALSLWTNYEQQLNQIIRNMKSKGWDCALTEEYLEFANEDGVTTQMLWSKMEVVVEHPGAWVVRCGEYESIVFRQPLRDAGYEEEFLKLVGSPPSPTGS